MEPIAIVETITPAIAERWLKQNINNRHLSPVKSRRYAEIMARGDWGFTGDAITFDTSGNLLNGQHRLSACIRAAYSFEAVVVRGAESEAIHLMDIGKRRTLSDSFKIRGFLHPRSLAPAARALFALLKGRNRVMGAAGVTHSQAFKIVQDNPELIELVGTVCVPHFMDICQRAPQFAALMCLLRKADCERADVFMRQVVTGEGLTMTDPAYQLRVRYLRSKTAGTYSTDKRDVRVLLQYAVLAWNSYYRNRKLARMSLKNPGTIPRIRGLEGLAGW